MRRTLARLALAGVLVTGCSGGGKSVGVERPTTQPSSTAASSSTSASTAEATSTSSPTTLTSVPATTAASTTTTPPPATIRWEDCGDDLQCGTLAVPLDYAHPAEGTINLTVERRPARKPKQRIGSLLVNPGGPGAAGTLLAEQASFYFSGDLLDHFDIVGWDPRGTGRSAAVDCTDDLDPFYIGTDPTPSTPAAVQRLKDFSSVFIAGCEARSSAVLPYVSTQASARDMDRIRQALGESKISYFGFSYGSELGATWATMFPRTVRAAVLDGALDANAPWEERIGQQLAGLELGFTHAMDACAADSGCPFNNNGDPVTAYEQLAASLDAKPLVVDPHRPPANQSVLFNAVVYSLRDSSGWDELYRALADAQAGKGNRLYALNDTALERRNNGTFSNTLEDFTAISCLDDNGPTDPSQYAAIDARFNRIAPDMNFGTGYNYTCGQWPVRSAPPLRLTAKDAGPVVVVGTTGDPITPLDSSRQLAADLEQGRLVTVEGDRHTGYRINTCSQKAVDSYLIDLDVPAAGTFCR